jgi:hypothetical protein
MFLVTEVINVHYLNITLKHNICGTGSLHNREVCVNSSAELLTFNTNTLSFCLDEHTLEV